jgi:hypothetical protein
MMTKKHKLPTLESIAAKLQELGQQARYILKHTELDLTRKRSLKNPQNYEVELVQVAAVAVAALTDFKMQQNSNRRQDDVESEIFGEIIVERDRQDTKFNRLLPIGLDPLIWGAVLTEEVAEVMAEVEIKENDRNV